MNPREKRLKKLAWLRQNRALWEGENLTDPLYSHNRPLLRKLAKALVAAALLSPKTSLIDVHIDDLIRKAHHS